MAYEDDPKKKIAEQQKKNYEEAKRIQEEKKVIAAQQIENLKRMNEAKQYRESLKKNPFESKPVQKKR